MSENAAKSEAATSGKKLPPGRHKLPREVVVANQRERLLHAATEALAEHGYSGLKVDQVIEGASVSRATFYEQFADKHDVALAAHAAAFERLRQEIVIACGAHSDWPAGVAAAVGAALDFTVESPAQASLVLISSPTAADPRLGRHWLVVHQHLAGLLRDGRERMQGRPAPLELTEDAAIGAAVSVVSARLIAGELDQIPALKPELVQLILTPYLGSREARSVALAA